MSASLLPAPAVLPATRVQEMKCRLGCSYGPQRFHHTERGFIASLLIKEAYKPADLLQQYLRMFSAAQLGKIPE